MAVLHKLGVGSCGVVTPQLSWELGVGSCGVVTQNGPLRGNSIMV